ncbi:MAG: hypothetical protein OXH15_15665 [Gammaproteobacteria bacterium]|nr:hypothetical protein [Gammaproteobacteria bacterium]
MESGLRFSPDGEARYRTSAYMQQLWMAATAQTLAAKGEAQGCSSMDWADEEASFECPLGHDDYIFTFTYDPRDGASVLRVHDTGNKGRVDPDQIEDLVWELPGADDQEALDRAAIDHIAIAMEVFTGGTSKGHQAAGTRHSVDDTINYAARTLARLVLGSNAGLATARVEAQLTYRVELKDGQVFEHRYVLPPTDIEGLLTDLWPSHASEARWTLATQYEARQLKALQAARRQSEPSS